MRSTGIASPGDSSGSNKECLKIYIYQFRFLGLLSQTNLKLIYIFFLCIYIFIHLYIAFFDM